MLWLPPEHSRTHLFYETNSQKKKKKRPTPSLLARGHQPEEKNPSQCKDLNLEPGKGPHRPPAPQGGQHGHGRGCRRRRSGCASRQESPGGSLQGASRVCLQLTKPRGLLAPGFPGCPSRRHAHRCHPTSSSQRARQARGQVTRMTLPPSQPGLSRAPTRLAREEMINECLLSTSGQQRAAPSLGSTPGGSWCPSTRSRNSCLGPS